jgi:hypothetical protein
MKSIPTWIAASALLASLATAQSRYAIIDLGLVGGAPGRPSVIANNGLYPERCLGFAPRSSRTRFWLTFAYSNIPASCIGTQ